MPGEHYLSTGINSYYDQEIGERLRDEVLDDHYNPKPTVAKGNVKQKKEIEKSDVDGMAAKEA